MWDVGCVVSQVVVNKEGEGKQNWVSSLDVSRAKGLGMSSSMPTRSHCMLGECCFWRREEEELVVWGGEGDGKGGEGKGKKEKGKEKGEKGERERKKIKGKGKGKQKGKGKRKRKWERK